jgi:hypothetical protein
VASIVPTGFGAAYHPTYVYYENSLSGSGFSSLMEPIAGPYESSWLTTVRVPGDPPLPGNAPKPGSPVVGGVGGAGLPPFSPVADDGVPEPVSVVLAALGLGSLGGLRAVRARRVAPGAPTGR